MQRLMLLGLNHTTAALEVREKLAFDARQRDAALSALRDRFGPCEVLLLSTCNRVEIYVARETHGHPRPDELFQFLGDLRQLPVDQIKPHSYQKTERAVVAHLFAVASSLDSMVLGETQILGQVRQAYDAARNLGVAGTMLNPLFQRAIAVGKEILTQTSLAEGRLSIASVAADYAGQIFDTFSDKTVLCVGAGKMAGLFLAKLASLKPGKILICNRDPAKAIALTQKYGGEPAAYENLSEHLAAADIIVTSTGSTTPIITRPMFETVMRRRRYKSVFLIDIALPRDVAADVGELENVFLYNLDDLQQTIAATRTQRGAALQAANEILNRHVEEFIAWQRTRELGPVIDQLYRRSHALAQEELFRTLSKLTDVSAADREHLEDLTRRIVNKLLHDPIQQLRESDNLHGSGARYLHAVEKIFQLETPDDPPQSDDQ
jgi:glutamyl-tRNA reductase